MANLLAGLSSKTTVHSWSEVTSACGTGDSDSNLNWKLCYKPPPESLPESSSSIRKNIILLNERLTTFEKKMMTSPDETVKTLEDKLENPDEGVKMLEDKVTSSSMQNNIIFLNEKVKKLEDKVDTFELALQSRMDDLECSMNNISETLQNNLDTVEIKLDGTFNEIKYNVGVCLLRKIGLCNPNWENIY